MIHAGTLLEVGSARQPETLVCDPRFLLLGFKAP